jgi:FkbM family methyltransferase
MTMPPGADPRNVSGDSLSAAMRAAVFLNRYLPRGKGAVPRWIGGRLRREAGHFIVTRHGAKLVVEPSSLDVYACIVNSGRTWNWHVLTACAAFLRPGDTFLDIGANIGFMSLELARVFGSQAGVPGIRVVAFEPLPPLVAAIRESVPINPAATVDVREEIVSDSAGTMDLFLGSHSIHASTRAREEGSRTLRLPTVRVDDLVESGEIPPPHVIKIDVEGGEFAAFRGAESTLRRHQPQIIFESDENTARFGYTRRDLCGYLAGIAPYRFLAIKPHGTGFSALSPDSDASADPADILATTLPEPAIAAASDSIRHWTRSGRIVPVGLAPSPGDRIS